MTSRHPRPASSSSASIGSDETRPSSHASRPDTSAALPPPGPDSPLIDQATLSAATAPLSPSPQPPAAMSYPTSSSAAADSRDLASPPPFDDSAYFDSNPAPASLKTHLPLARAFIDAHAAAGRRVVLITSGGTTVPLENQTVRFIDNFSAGTRGATSAEYFLAHGYAVCFLHRQFSLLPFSRHYSHSTNCFLDFVHEGPDGAVVINDEYRAQMLAVWRQYQDAKKHNMLLLLPFTTITQYLWELKEIALLMRPLGASGMFYLAAAVSDFFVPRHRMAEHKIQSTDGGSSAKKKKNERDNIINNNNDISSTSTSNTTTSTNTNKLIIDLDPVPKFLQPLVEGWAPESMIISFKLETDPSLLLAKAHHALARYQHHLVIGNLLATRKWEVVFVRPGEQDCWLRVPRHRRAKSVSGVQAQVGRAALRDSVAEEGPTEKEAEGEDGEGNFFDQRAAEGEAEPEMEIESLIVPEVVRLHSQMLASAAGSK
ncbi:MAG: hypothetical protein M1824_000726 [Vezdaea acicularis]|nr:MAG: hypothetical protein M1824_000726 [Vezdaea acicularis]